jgi:hypothetical protein
MMTSMTTRHRGTEIRMVTIKGMTDHQSRPKGVGRQKNLVHIDRRMRKTAGH